MLNMENEKRIDFLGIGDTVVDAFIKLTVAHVEQTAKGQELCLSYGAKIPYDSVTIVPAVGNSANATVSASRLGLSTSLLTFLGNDKYGDECIERLNKENIDTSLITREEGKETNYHYVLWYGDDRTILIKHTPFEAKLPEIGKPSFIYLSSLGEHTLSLHNEIGEYLEQNKEVKLSFQPGGFQIKLGHEKLKKIYENTYAFCVNKEEAELILEVREDDIKKLLDGVSNLGPKIVIITDGHNGSYMKYEEKHYFMPIYPDIAPPFERTGAGDAFFSTFTAFLAKGMSAKEAIMRAPINSMNVVQHVGAQDGLLTEQEIEEYLKKSKEDYRLEII